MLQHLNLLQIQRLQTRNQNARGNLRCCFKIPSGRARFVDQLPHFSPQVKLPNVRWREAINHSLSRTNIIIGCRAENGNSLFPIANHGWSSHVITIEAIGNGSSRKQRSARTRNMNVVFVGSSQHLQDTKCEVLYSPRIYSASVVQQSIESARKRNVHIGNHPIQRTRFAYAQSSSKLRSKPSLDTHRWHHDVLTIKYVPARSKEGRGGFADVIKTTDVFNPHRHWH